MVADAPEPKASDKAPAFRVTDVFIVNELLMVGVFEIVLVPLPAQVRL